MKHIMCVLVAMMLLTGMCLGAEPTPKGKTIALKAVTCWPKTNQGTDGFMMWINKVNERAKGEGLVINYLGSTEVIPTLEQFEAVRRGMVDVIFTTAGYYEAAMPEGASTALTQLTPWEERESGYYDFLAQAHKKLNAVYMGRMGTNDPFYLYAKTPVKDPHTDFKGRKFRTMVLYDSFLKELGIVPVTVPPGDTYTALERGVVEGFAWFGLGVRDFGWNEVCKYIINVPFFEMNSLILVNLDAWNRLPENLRSLMRDVTLVAEREAHAYYGNLCKVERQKLIEGGMKEINFSPADAKWFRDLAFESRWKDVMKLNPESGPRMKKMLTPK